MSGTVHQSSWLSIDGGLNLRDIGGLPCVNGGSTRHGVLLRSGSLGLLTADDAAALMAVLGVETVIDLRTAREVAADGPSCSPGPGQRGTDPVAALERAYRGDGDRGAHRRSARARPRRSAGPPRSPGCRPC